MSTEERFRHAIGEPCDICDGRGFDYIGRTCRRLIDGSEERFSACDFAWDDGWGAHTCHLNDGHDGDHRCGCDATHHEWTHEDEDAMLNDRHRAETRDGP